MLEPRSTAIARLTVHRGGRDPLLDRLRLDQILAGADLHPAGLPASAILLVRALGDPRPGTLRLDRRGGAAEWQRDARSVIADKLRVAHRPRDGAVPPDADAVLFADRAELIACLLRDWHAGTARSRWWWRLLRCDADPLAWAAAELTRQPEWLPPAFAALAEHGAVMPVARGLEASVAHALLVALCRRFALVDLEAVVAALPAEVASSRPRAADLLVAAVAPWAPGVVVGPGADEAAPVEAQLLAAVAIAIQRAPAMARSRGFAVSMAARIDALRQRVVWSGEALRGSLGPEPLPLAAMPPRRTRLPAAEAVHDAAARPALVEGTEASFVADASAAAANATKAAPVGATVQPASPFDAPARSAEPLPAWPELPRVAEATAAVEAATSVRSPDEAVVIDRRIPVDGIASDATTAGVSPAPSQLAAAAVEPVFRIVDTELGGLFFLVNLALFLDLYGDFTRPGHVDLGMPLFDFVTLLGRELAGRDDDPIWALLAELAGRSDAPPAADFVPPTEWQVPDAWLAPFAGDTGDWVIASRDGALQLRHPAGFVAIELPLAAATPSLSRWLSWLVPYCRARLVRALGEADLSPLWRRTARVYVTGARLDVEFHLHDHPLEVRIAGLDRDPGWLPGTGRDLRFHFR